MSQLDNNLIEKINKAKWPENQKKLLLELLPNFGLNFQNFVLIEAGKLGFEYLSEVLPKLMQQLLDIGVSKLKDSDGFLSLLASAPDDPEKDCGQMVLPWVMDFYSENKENFSTSDEVYGALAYFFSKMFNFLPEKFCANFFEHYTFFSLIRGIDLLFLSKKYIYKKRWVGDSNKTKFFLDALFKNQEIITSSPITYLGSKVNGNVSEIISKFATSNNNFRKISSLEVTKFVSDIRGVQENERKAILKLLILYLWLLSPNVTESEIYDEDYSEILTEIDPGKFFRKEILIGFFSPDIPSSTQNSNLVMKTSDFSNVGYVNIDQKLQELRRRAEKDGKG